LPIKIKQRKMKQSNFLSMALIVVLMVFAVSCTPLQESVGGYEEAPGRRVYRQMPYGGNQVIVLERDPFTGQYFQVSPYGYYGGPLNTFGHPAFGNRGGGGVIYQQGNARSRISNQPASRMPQQQQQPAQRGSETTNRAKDIIRGN
jgi:hypothetical protein